MPGSTFEIVCPGCSARHELWTGVGYYMDSGEPFEYAQRICPACKRIRSLSTPPLPDAPPGCHECGTELEDWPGRVWFERDEERDTSYEQVEGPCPACGTTISLANVEMLGLWD